MKGEVECERVKAERGGKSDPDGALVERAKEVVYLSGVASGQESLRLWLISSELDIHLI